MPHKKARHARARVGGETALRVVTAHVLLPWVIGTALVFVALVALDQLILHTNVLTSFRGLSPLSPLYAFWMPEFRPAAVLFVLLALPCTFLLPRLVGSRTSTAHFAASLLILSLALPLALFLVREEPVQIGSQFLIYPAKSTSTMRYTLST